MARPEAFTRDSCCSQMQCVRKVSEMEHDQKLKNQSFNQTHLGFGNREPKEIPTTRGDHKGAPGDVSVIVAPGNRVPLTSPALNPARWPYAPGPLTGGLSARK